MIPNPLGVGWGLSLVAGVAANCASALAQMAAASCVQEEKEEREVQEPSDTIAQGTAVHPLSSYSAMIMDLCGVL